MRLSEQLRDRTKGFASMVIRFFISLPRERLEVAVLAKQILGAGTSASRARSDSEFCSKPDVLLQEADETQLWLELLIDDCGITDPRLPQTHREAGELPAIFTTMVFKSRSKI